MSCQKPTCSEKGRAEDGRIPSRYNLTELSSISYAVRGEVGGVQPGPDAYRRQLSNFRVRRQNEETGDSYP